MALNRFAQATRRYNRRARPKNLRLFREFGGKKDLTTKNTKSTNDRFGRASDWLQGIAGKIEFDSTRTFARVTQSRSGSFNNRSQLTR